MPANRVRVTNPRRSVTVVRPGGVAAVHPTPAANVPHVDKVRHVVSGPAGKDGRNGIDGVGALLMLTAAEAIPAYTVVAVRADGLAYKASSLNVEDSDRLVGVAATSALSGEEVSVRETGSMDHPGPLSVGDLFLGPTGALVSNARTGALFAQIAQATTPTRLTVRIGQVITLTQ